MKTFEAIGKGQKEFTTITKKEIAVNQAIKDGIVRTRRRGKVSLKM